MAADQIQQREQINPDDIDQVPVQAGVFYGREVAGRVMSPPCQDSQHTKKSAANDHVQGMHAGHGEIEGEKKLGFVRRDRDLLAVVVKGIRELKRWPWYVVLLEFLGVLETFDHEEGHTEQHSNDEIANQHLALARLRRLHRQYNRNRTNDQDRGIQCSELDAELLASGREGIEVGETLDEVSAEHAAEEHDFRH